MRLHENMNYVQKNIEIVGNQISSLYLWQDPKYKILEEKSFEDIGSAFKNVETYKNKIASNKNNRFQEVIHIRNDEEMRL